MTTDSDSECSYVTNLADLNVMRVIIIVIVIQIIVYNSNYRNNNNYIKKRNNNNSICNKIWENS